MYILAVSRVLLLCSLCSLAACESLPMYRDLALGLEIESVSLVPRGEVGFMMGSKDSVDHLVKRFGSGAYEVVSKDKLFRIRLSVTCDIIYMSNYMSVSFSGGIERPDGARIHHLDVFSEQLDSWSTDNTSKRSVAKFSFDTACQKKSYATVYVPMIMRNWGRRENAFDYGTVCPMRDCDLLIEAAGGGFDVGTVSSNTVRVPAEMITRLLYE